MQRSLILFLLVVFSISFAYWADSINVTVYSKDGVPMKNVPVTVIYQVNRCGSHSEITKITNDSGSVSFTLINTVDESFGKCIERVYTIRADFGGYSNSTIGQVDRKDKNYQLWLPFITHVVSVRNSINGSVAGATVTAYNISYTTDSSGNAYILLPVGTLSQFSVSYKEISVQSSANPSINKVSYITLPIYDLKVSLTDENGNQLYGSIRYKEEEKILNDSFVIFKDFSDINPTFYVTVDGNTKKVSAIISSDNIILRYDTLPPIIKDVETRIANERVYITATIVDPGRYPSGIASNPILSYESNLSRAASQKMFFIGNNKYETSILLQGDEEIRFNIVVSDAQGNIANYSDVYITSFKLEKEIERATRGFTWLTFLGILIFAIIVYIVYLKIKEQSQ